MGNLSKLKTNLKIAVQRLKLLEKKKSENAKKATKEIADYLSNNKIDRAKIKVEHIIREDYSVEAMEILEMYLDMLLARFGMVEAMKELDMGLYECVASILWASPRLESECSELKIISSELQHKYGKDFAQMCRENKSSQVNERLMQKMNEQAPGDLLVEKYLVEIAKSHNVAYTPNPELSIRDPDYFFNNTNNQSGGGNGGGSSESQAKQRVSYIDFSLPQRPQSSKKSDIAGPANEASFIFPAIPEGTFKTKEVNKSDESADSFDDLAKRFENLKKK